VQSAVADMARCLHWYKQMFTVWLLGAVSSRVEGSIICCCIVPYVAAALSALPTAQVHSAVLWAALDT
jgi:hypothetical protein